MDTSGPFAEFAARLRFDALPEAVQERARWILADTIAAIVGGSAEPELRAFASRQQRAAGPCSLIGLGQLATAEAAALVNGTAGTFLEMDEGNRFARGHPSVHVLPAVLALCEARSLPVERLLSGLVAGYEVGARLGAASDLRSSMHAHGTWGAMGAAAGCAAAVCAGAGLARETLNISASLTTATSKKTMLEGGLVRNVYAGLAARSGLLALDLAESGFTGEVDGITSLLGTIVSERFDGEAALAGLGTDWTLLQSYFKLHACCRYNHATLDALDVIDEREGLPSPASIEMVEVQTYSLAAELSDPRPRNTLAAKFSVPFAVATRIVRGSSDVRSFTTEALNSPDALALAQRVRVSEDLSMTARLPRERPARVTITMRDGRRSSAEVSTNRGDDVSPYRQDELITKFHSLTGRVWPRAHCDQLLDMTLVLGRPGVTIDRWVSLLRAAPVADAASNTQRVSP